MDRDFLFGVIAVQLGQATPAQVMAAASAFIADPSRSIPDRLRDEGMIEDVRFKMLEAMVGEAVKAHGGDVRRTVQSLGGERALLASFGFDPSLWDMAGHVRLKRFASGASGAFSPDSTRLAIGSKSGDVVLWDVASRGELSTLRGHPSMVRHLAFSPDGQTLATGDRQGGVRVWDLATGALRYQLTGSAGVAISPDGRVLATTDRPSGIRLWELASGKALRRLEGHTTEVDDITFSHDGKWLASGDMSGGLRLWDLEHADASHELIGHSTWINSVEFSPDDTLLITGSDDWDARIWSVAAKATVLKIKTPSECVGTTFSADGKSVIVDWGNAARQMSLDLSLRDADPKQLLDAAQREAGLELDGMLLTAPE